MGSEHRTCAGEGLEGPSSATGPDGATDIEADDMTLRALLTLEHAQWAARSSLEQMHRLNMQTAVT